MLALANKTAYAAERNLGKDNRGALHWVVAVRASFDIERNGRLRAADEQTSPAFAPEYFGDPGASSIRWDADLTLMKPSTDVLVNGSAHASNGRRSAEVAVRLRVDTLSKSLLVRGENVHYRGPTGWTTSAPRPFDSMPIRYERAFGGFDQSDPNPAKHRLDPRNPIGRGFVSEGSARDHLPGPNVIYPTGKVERVGPAGFGALASYWSPRLELGGTYDDNWKRVQKPLLPVDWKSESLLVSPPDQRFANYLRGGEPILLSGMSPDGELRFELPKLYFAFATHFGSRVQEHRGRLVTVLVEPSERCLACVWQSTLEISLRDVDRLDKTVIIEKPYLT
jgi:hypothetical protein